MTGSRGRSRGTGEESKQPFVNKEDRPDVRISLDTPIGELRVRELSAILGFHTGKNANFEVGKTSLKDFFDKDFPEVAKDWIKEVKSDKLEKNEKIEKNEKLEKNEKIEKPEKYEKPEKPEVKEVKAEKLETDGVLEPRDPSRADPRMEQLIQAISGLSQQVNQIADQVEALEKKVRA